jgi:hypothetical protein
MANDLSYQELLRGLEGLRVRSVLSSANGWLVEADGPKSSERYAPSWASQVADSAGSHCPTPHINGRRILAHVDATLLENRADVRAAVTGLRDTLARSTVLLDRLNQSLDQNSGNIDELLDNVRVSTENLKGLTETLRSRPASLIRGIHAEDRQPGGPQK